ncbi:putative zinc finger protein 66 [Anoplophora glabripennis]|uniref:putative zinc finger protein 66 n=1 Tax=Anoplophora glabripennis TaxID=217634 RepID=UPI000874E8BE|nr:putative zinc finger protein 66 [Anoplophora glabripennis]
MGNEGNLLCSLCLCPIWDKNAEEIGDTTKEIFDVIFVNKNLWLDKGQPICQLCSRKIQDSFSFKCNCIYTEDFLVPFVSAVGGSQINLMDIFKGNVKSEKEIRDNQKVCRLCLQIIAGPVNSLLVETEFDLIQKFMPEIMIHNTSDPVACEACTKQLHNFASFIIDCVSVHEKKNKRHKNDSTYINKGTLSTDGYKNVEERSGIEKCDLNLNIKNEDCREENQYIPAINDSNFYIKNAGVMTHTGQYYNRSLYPLPLSLPMPQDDKDSMNPSVFQHRYNGEYKQKESDDDKSSVLYDMDLHIVKTEKLNHKQPEAEICKSKYRNCIKKFQDASRAKSYKCQHCSYHTKYLSALKSHSLNHTYPSKMELYACEECDYKTKHRTALKSHMLNHAHPSEIEFYSCDECDYKTKHRNALKSHKLNHAHPSEIELYSCDKCDYKTKYRNALKSHQLNHKPPSEIEMRKCNQCSYETKHRTALVLHMLKHKSPGEIQMYRCDKCKFQTKFKHALKPHKLKHKGDT